MLSVMRVYDPSECGTDSAPLDWERCRTCATLGDGKVFRGCEACGGHGSLKAAALHALIVQQRGRHPGAGPFEPLPADFRVGCESCGHPMSDGAWEDPQHLILRESVVPWAAEMAEREGPDVSETFFMGMAHWSACDERCRHAGRCQTQSRHEAPGRWVDGMYSGDVHTTGDMVRICEMPVRCSGRQVGVRTLGWAHDLRPEKLAVLCLRCRFDPELPFIHGRRA